jgi:hypothetical protein
MLEVALVYNSYKQMKELHHDLDTNLQQKRN